MKKEYIQPKMEILLPLVDKLMQNAAISPGPATPGEVDAPGRKVTILYV